MVINHSLGKRLSTHDNDLMNSFIIPIQLPAGSSGAATGSTSSSTSSVRQTRQRITRVNLRDLIFCMEQERTTARSMLLYKALLK